MGLFGSPVKKQVKKLDKSAKEAYKRIQITNDRAMIHEKNIEQTIQQIKKELLSEHLKNVSVDELNRYKEGIRVSVLRSAGYDTIAKLYGKTAAQIKSISGIGPDNAVKIVNNVTEIAKQEENNIVIRIDPQKRDMKTDKLVKELYMYIKEKKLVSELQNMLKEYQSNISPDIKKYKSSVSYFKWMFMSGDNKKKIAKEFDDYSARINETFVDREKSIKDQIQLIERTAVNDCYKDFEENAALYNSVLQDGTDSGDVRAEDSELYSGRVVIPSEIMEKINSITLNEELMESTLRRYQAFGAKYTVAQKRTLLGDEMGLGKTIQAIAAMAHLKIQGKQRFIVICPLSVMVNWEREIEKHSMLEAISIHGNNRQALFEEWKNTDQIAVTTYETISKIAFDEAGDIDMVIVDEAHNVKNPQAKRTKNVVKLVDKAEYVLYMTGTPLENRIEEMQYLIQSVNPEVGKEISSVTTYKEAAKFKNAIIPVYLRRVREDVLKELPELIEIEDWLPMNKTEKEVYKHTLQSNNFMAVRRISWNAGTDKSSKAQRLMEICENAADDERKVIVFSYFRDTLELVKTLLGDRCIGQITGDISPQMRQSIIDDFTNAPAGTVLVSQVEAGGVGLNIQTASVVVFCEPQFKPSIENQAIARAYRMGQVRSVMVHRLLIAKSVDERIISLLKEKSKLFDEFADESVVGAEDIKINEGQAMQQIVAEEIKRLDGEAEDDEDDDEEDERNDRAEGTNTSKDEDGDEKI